MPYGPYRILKGLGCSLHVLHMPHMPVCSLKRDKGSSRCPSLFAFDFRISVVSSPSAAKTACLLVFGMFDGKTEALLPQSRAASNFPAIEGLYSAGARRLMP
jgi:hypothetical protein